MADHVLKGESKELAPPIKLFFLRTSLISVSIIVSKVQVLVSPMARSVFEASIFHLSPSEIDWLYHEEEYIQRVTSAPHLNGFLIQCDFSAVVFKKDLLPQVNSILRHAPCHTTHLFLDPDGPILADPPAHREHGARETSAEAEVLAAYTAGGQPRSDRMSYRRSRSDHYPRFDGVPENFEQIIINCAQRMRDFRWMAETENSSMGLSWQAYTLARDAEELKRHTGQPHAEYDEALLMLRDALDQSIEAFDAFYTRRLQKLENSIFMAKTRVCRALAVTSDCPREAAT